MEGANILAYYDVTKIMFLKSFIVQASGGAFTTKLFTMVVNTAIL
jgi:hypothetical protein